MKKKYLHLLAVIAVIAAYMVVVVVVLPTRSGVTKANFNRIKMGMTYAEVVEIIGERPRFDPFASNLASDFEPRLWWASNGSYARFRFTNDRVAHCTWQDSNETFWDKLRRWVGWK
jgi:hypothetical protein